MRSSIQWDWGHIGRAIRGVQPGFLCVNNLAASSSTLHRTRWINFYISLKPTEVEIVASSVANFHHPEYPEFEDFGEVLLRTPKCTGYVRVDWFTPEGLDTWGDTRLTVIGTDGYIEVRKNIDVASRPGSDHLFLVDQKGTQYIDCQQVELPFGRLLLDDIRNRTETAIPQAHVFYAMELALAAQAKASRLGHLQGK